MPSSSTNSAFADDETTLRDHWRILLRRRVTLCITIAIVVFGLTILALVLPNVYESKVVLIPLGGSTNSLLSSIGELGNLLPGATGGSDNPGTRILAILQSRTLAEDVIRRLNLLPFLFPDDWNPVTQKWMVDPEPTILTGVKALQEEVVVSTWDETKGTLTVAAQHRDPVLAAAIANMYIEILQQKLHDNAFSLAKKNRVFVEGQLHNTEKDLAAVEEAVQKFEQKYGIVALDAQAQAAVTTIAGLEAQIMAKEVSLGVLQRTLTGSSREVYLLREELQGLRTQLSRLQQGSPSLSPALGNGGKQSQVLLSLDKAPDIKLHYTRLQRDLAVQTKLFALLTQQFEQAKIEEARDETAFQLLDRAVPPDLAISPKRVLLIALSLVLGPMIGIVAAFFREFIDPIVRTREQVEQKVQLPVLTTVDPADDEAYRYLYTRLKYCHDDRGVHTLVFTSPESSETTATVLSNLASIAATGGEKILLVDANIHTPFLHQWWQCSLSPGLVDLLLNPEEWQKGVHTTKVKNVHLVPAGVLTATKQVALEGAAFDTLLGYFQAVYDTIFFAAPAVQSSTDAAVLSSKVAATCLVLTAGISRLEATMEAKASLEAVQGQVIGAVLTRAQKNGKTRRYASPHSPQSIATTSHNMS